MKGLFVLISVVAAIAATERTGLPSMRLGPGDAGPAHPQALAAQPTALDPKEMGVVEKIRARIEEQSKKTPRSGSYTVTVPNTVVTYTMVPVPAGEFTMGSSAADAKPDEKPAHNVKLDAFWMQAHEVTWDLYLMFMFADQAKEGEHPDAMVDALSRPTAPFLEMSFGRGNNGFPAISMTQHAANKFAQWLSAKTGEYYRLPTEAEWEYAARAGQASQPALSAIAWFGLAESSARPSRPQAVATKTPNAWGLYDMLGNVAEWCTGRDGTPVVRGGSYDDEVKDVGCAARKLPSDVWNATDPQNPKSKWWLADGPFVGFRIVCEE